MDAFPLTRETSAVVSGASSVTCPSIRPWRAADSIPSVSATSCSAMPFPLTDTLNVALSGSKPGNAMIPVPESRPP